jgi:hypothetical protein
MAAAGGLDAAWQAVEQVAPSLYAVGDMRDA